MYNYWAEGLVQACVSRYDQSSWTANWWRSSKWCTHCKHRCAAPLAHTQDCHIKKRNWKLERCIKKSD